MTIVQRLVCGVGTLSMLSGCRPWTMPAATPGHDVIPQEWIGHNGLRRAKAVDEFGQRVFPSQPASQPVRWPTTTDVSMPVVGVVGLWNGLKCSSQYECPFRADIQICVKRDGKTLTFSAAKKSIDEIRRLDWRQFQTLQCDFEQWLFEQTDTNLLTRLLFPPRLRFAGRAYDQGLRDFWLECLTSAQLSSYGMEERRHTHSSPDVSRQKGGNIGPTMGAFVLEPGMRLNIYWGGTAVYAYGQSKDRIVRQTTTGSTIVDVIYRNQRVVLAMPRYMLADPHSSGGPLVNDDWAIESFPPLSDNTASQDFLPFGDSAGLNRKFVPVSNYLDLFHNDALAKSGDADRGAVAPYLTLLVPAKYAKSDFPTSHPANVPGTSDALGASASRDNRELWITFARRYMIWGTDVQFRDPQTDSPYLTAMSDPAKPDPNDWTYAPLVFGNQTSIAVEVPVSVNREPSVYVPVGTTWGDLLDAKVRWAMTASQTGIKLAKIERFAFAPDPDGQIYNPVEFRFHSVPMSALRSVEVAPGDVLCFSRGRE